MHNYIDNCPEVVAHLHWKLWPWRPPQFHLPSPGSACCATLHCQVLHLNNIQCNCAIEQYPVQYCIWLNNIQCNFAYEQYSVLFCNCWTTMHCIKIHKHNSIMHCKALNQDLKIQQSKEFTYAGVALPCSSCVPSDDPYFTVYILLTVINCTSICFPCLILLS